MLTHPSISNLHLYTLQDLKNGIIDLPELEFQAVKTAMNWVGEFLCNPYEELGRPGPVCPFVKRAIESHNSVYVTSVAPARPTVKSIENVLRQCREWFNSLNPVADSQKNFKTIMVVLPTVTDDESGAHLIDEIHQKLKPSFVRRSLMLGQFYPTCEESGLHNPEYRPLQSPVSLFAIRSMQLTDLAFLVQDDRYIRAYCNTFGVNDAGELQKLVNASKIPKPPLNWEEYVATLFEESVVEQAT